MEPWDTSFERIAGILIGETWGLTLWKYSASHSAAEFVLYGQSSKRRSVLLMTGVTTILLDTIPRHTELRLSRDSALLELWGQRILVRGERIQWRDGEPSPTVSQSDLEEMLRR